ncbi:MAG TPA: caspase family protein [Polyangia bacterium]|nr:caspase family protein [Polyangia bacterium]
MYEAQVADAYRCHAPAILAHCRRLLASPSLAGDATQEVFVKVLAQDKRLPPGGLTRLDLLVDTSIEAVSAAMRAVRARVDADRAQGRRTLFLFYYSGHGDQDGLELRGRRLSLRRLREYLESLEADVKIAFLDSCQSGSLTGIKGGRLAPAYEVRLADAAGARGLAMVTSSTASELSQESDELKASFFSHAVLSGLRGAADSSGDGRVTLGEVYQYALRRTISTTAASPVGGQHPTYDYRMAGVGDVVLTHFRRGDARLVFPRGVEGTFVVLASDEVVAEVAGAADTQRYLVLPAGRYRVFRRHAGAVTEAPVVLRAQEERHVDPAVMAEVVDLPTVAKGGAPVSSVVAGDLAFQTSALRGTGVFVGAIGASFLHRFESIGFRIGALLSRFEADDRGYRSDVIRLQPSLDLRATLWQGRSSLAVVGLRAAAPMAWQRDDGDAGHWGFGAGAGYGVLAGIETRLLDTWRLAIDLTGGGETFKLNGVIVTRPTFGLALGVGYGF